MVSVWLSGRVLLRLAVSLSSTVLDELKKGKGRKFRPTSEMTSMVETDKQTNNVASFLNHLPFIYTFSSRCSAVECFF